MKLATILLAVCAPISVCAAQQCGVTHVTDFSNTLDGGWNWGGPNQTTPASNGFPGAYLRTEGLDTFAPQLRTTGTSIFTGDYRAAGVSALSVDLRSFSIDFPTSCQRPLSLVLTDDNGTPGNFSDDTFVYYVSPDDIPCVDGLWRSYSVEVPSSSATLPAGWAADPNATVSPDAVWNRVIANVTEVNWFFGDPTFFFIFQMWTVGADNLRIAFDGGATTYCTSQLNSASCQPKITASGTPSATQPTTFDVTCSDVVSQKAGLFFYGYDRQSAPFNGGFMCAVLPLRRTPVQNSGGSVSGTDCTGSFAFDLNAWIQAGSDPALQPGAELYGQFWSRDPQSATSNVNLSNAVALRVCP
jgi:hypothetical protein